MSEKNWSFACVNRMLHETDTTGSEHRKCGSGRLRIACSGENVKPVEELVLS